MGACPAVEGRRPGRIRRRPAAGSELMITVPIYAYFSGGRGVDLSTQILRVDDRCGTSSLKKTIRKMDY